MLSDLDVNKFVCLCICLFVCLCICLFVCVFVCLCICLFVCVFRFLLCSLYYSLVVKVSSSSSFCFIVFTKPLMIEILKPH